MDERLLTIFTALLTFLMVFNVIGMLVLFARILTVFTTGIDPFEWY